jgi:hypothetical protein
MLQRLSRQTPIVSNNEINLTRFVRRLSRGRYAIRSLEIAGETSPGRHIIGPVCLKRQP